MIKGEHIAMGGVVGILSAAILTPVFLCDRDRRQEEQKLVSQGFNITEYRPLTGKISVLAGTCEVELDYKDSRYTDPIVLTYHGVGKTFSVTKPEDLRHLVPAECY